MHAHSAMSTVSSMTQPCARGAVQFTWQRAQDGAEVLGIAQQVGAVATLNRRLPPRIISTIGTQDSAGGSIRKTEAPVEMTFVVR